MRKPWWAKKRGRVRLAPAVQKRRGFSTVTGFIQRVLDCGGHVLPFFEEQPPKDDRPSKRLTCRPSLADNPAADIRHQTHLHEFDD